MTKKLIPVLAGFLIILGLAGTSRVSAGSQDYSFPPIIQKIVDKFGLNKEEVQSLLEESQKEHQEQMQTRLEEQLSQAVSDGKITEEQKTALLAKHQELQEERQANRVGPQNTTPEEMRSAFEQKKAELETWASENNIDPEILPSLGLGFGDRGGFHKGFKEGWAGQNQ